MLHYFYWSLLSTWSRKHFGVFSILKELPDRHYTCYNRVPDHSCVWMNILSFFKKKNQVLSQSKLNPALRKVHFCNLNEFCLVRKHEWIALSFLLLAGEGNKVSAEQGFTWYNSLVATTEAIWNANQYYTQSSASANSVNGSRNDQVPVRAGIKAEKDWLTPRAMLGLELHEFSSEALSDCGSGSLLALTYTREISGIWEKVGHAAQWEGQWQCFKPSSFWGHWAGHSGECQWRIHTSKPSIGLALIFTDIFPPPHSIYTPRCQPQKETQGCLC